MAKPDNSTRACAPCEEALAAVQHNAEGHCEAEVYRLKGELLLQQSAAQQGEAEDYLH